MIKMNLSDKDIEIIKAEAINGLLSTKRDGIEDLVDFMEKSGYFEVPASRSYHHNYKHGLLIHSYDVDVNLTVDLTDMGFKNPKGFSIPIVAYCHDMCKIKQYVFKNGKIEHNIEELNKGHGSYSAELAERFITLTYAEKMIIKYHMGIYYTNEKNPKNGEYTFNQLMETMKVYPHLLTFIYADVKSNGSINQNMQKHLNLLHANTESTATEFSFEV